jgi:hypothetical protein
MITNELFQRIENLERELAEARRQAESKIREMLWDLARTEQQLAEMSAIAEGRLTLLNNQEARHKKEVAKLAKGFEVAQQVGIELGKQRDNLASALENLCKAIISGEPRDITELLKKSGEALTAVKGGRHE